MLAARPVMIGVLVLAVAALAMLSELGRRQGHVAATPTSASDGESWYEEIITYQTLGEVEQLIGRQQAMIAEVTRIQRECPRFEGPCYRDEDIARIRAFLDEAERIGTLEREKLDQLQRRMAARRAPASGL